MARFTVGVWFHFYTLLAKWCRSSVKQNGEFSLQFLGLYF
jgi:hypothetical protein